ncbi:MAG TPA: NAD-dependent epimerase/dehydratase family protein, partial [Phenylobacterium sp.]|nr:NAD-dependent epimerase/dehydratase family protein [Phenylobacterium sp.]
MTGRLAAVTGATGFLGRQIVRALLADGWRVRLLARRDPVDLLWGGATPEVVIGDLGNEA